MGNNNNNNAKSRRWFLTGGLKDPIPKEMVKMLTADGKIVEVEKSVLDQVATKKRASNADIYAWMDNPSKKSNE